MAALAYLDTHVAAWLFAGDITRLSAAARVAIEGDDLLVSPAVILELQYLYETKRVADRAESVVEDLRHRLGVRVCDLPFAEVARRALPRRGHETRSIGSSWPRLPSVRAGS